MKHIVFFLTAALLLNASCGSSDEGGKTDPPAAPVPVAPTTELGKADEAIENLQLKPGKLISINQVNAANSAVPWLRVCASTSWPATRSSSPPT